MDQVHLMGIFIAVGEAKSFANAARRLDVSPAAVTRAISSMEEKLGAKLLLRTTRNVRLTEVGRRYLHDCKNILSVIDDAHEAVRDFNAHPSGHLAVTAPVVFGKLYIMPTIMRFMREFHEIEVSAYFLDRVVNLVDEGIDVAVRIGNLPDSSLKALRVGQVRRVLCASPAYLAKNGIPQHPTDLMRHTIVTASGVSPRVEWKFGKPDSSTTVRLKPRLSVTSNDAAVDAVRSGLGIGRLLAYHVAEELEEGRLQVILEEFEEPPSPVHVLHRESKYGAPKVRHFIDLLVDQLRSHQQLHELVFQKAKQRIEDRVIPLQARCV